MSSSTVYPDEPIPFTGEIHPYAARWPMRAPDEIESMAASIAARGLRLPIILSPEGVLVDGRNRLRACELAGVPPRFEIRAELDSPMAIAEFVWDCNGDLRRHMSKGSLAMMAALKPGPQRALSAHSGLSEGYINKARQVIEFCDEDTVEAVIADRLPLNQAYDEAQQIKATVQAEEIAAKKAAAEAKKEAERQAQLLATLTDKAPDLASLVNNGTMPLKEAIAACDARFEKDRREAALLAEKTAKLNRDVNAQVYLFAAYGEYPERLAELIDLWSPEHQPYRVTEETIRHAIAGLEAILNIVRSHA